MREATEPNYRTPDHPIASITERSSVAFEFRDGQPQFVVRLDRLRRAPAHH